jgi:hypothetical protein
MNRTERMQRLGQTDFEKYIAPIVSSAPAIYVKASLDGIIDLSLLKENGFEKVKKVVFSPGTILSIVNIPDTCEIIHCARNALTGIELTKNIKELDVEQNNLSEIQISLCPNLQKLNISHNKMEELENLPMTLKELNCSYNELHRLDLFGLDSLTNLVINNNKLISVLNIPTSLKYIRYDENPLKEIEQLETMKDLKVFGKKEYTVNAPPLQPEQRGDDDHNNDNSTETVISTDMDYKEALIKYFTMKKEYNAILKNKRKQIRVKTKNKDKLQLLLSEFKSNCIVCKRNVGTIFEKKNNHYIAICGDVGKNPCRLNIKIFNGDYYNFFDNMHYLVKEQLSINVVEIIKKKMDVVFNYINEKDALMLFNANLEKYNSSNEEYNVEFEIYKLLFENPAKKEITHLKTEKMYEIMGKIKEREIEYKKNQFNKELLTEIVEIYKTELIPAIVELRNVKYEDVGVICGEEDYSPCKLVQNEYKFEKFIYCTEEPKIIRFVV